MNAKQVPSKQKKVHTVAVRLDEETKRGLDELALRDERSTSEYMRRILRQHVAQELGGRGKK